MTTHTTLGADVAADARWRDWLARGAAQERRTAMQMRGVMVLVIAALIVIAIVQLT